MSKENYENHFGENIVAQKYFYLLNSGKKEKIDFTVYLNQAVKE